MDVNIRLADRIIRAVLGLALVLAPFLTDWEVFSTQWIVYASVLIGLVLGGTAIFGVCPIYRLVGINKGKT